MHEPTSAEVYKEWPIKLQHMYILHIVWLLLHSSPLYRYAVIPLWIGLSLIARLMQALAFGLLPNGTYEVLILYKAGPNILPAAAQIALGNLCLAGFVLFDFVYLAVVVTYVIQCELVRRVVDTRSNDIQDRRQNRIALTLEEAIQVRML